MQDCGVARRQVVTSFLASLFWIAAALACFAFLSSVTDIVQTDFIGINPNRSQRHAASLPFIFAPIETIVAVFGVLLVLGPSQLLLSAVVWSAPKRRWLLRVLLSLPFAAVVTWYSYDYLIPGDRYGLTLDNYLIALGAQSVVSLFSCARLYFKADGRPKASRRVGLALIAVGAAIGVAKGLHLVGA
ncbi:hypothetical protein EYW49_04470 [Siculibacillus lacustris]|uniref:Uncharacterized protein n=1 Tax=Siculibacillus lacustris TaxID=1549641 RepID=A0A4Q9VVZ0_9HYPH|nr:hypothetical protein [Siculibacillus lacustris]TBW40439.1 hypothetical protein EYW49_04470 [Siculibacillus lacustris]